MPLRAVLPPRDQIKMEGCGLKLSLSKFTVEADDVLRNIFVSQLTFSLLFPLLREITILAFAIFSCQMLGKKFIFD